MAALSALSAYVESDEEHDHEDADHEGHVGVIVNKLPPPTDTKVANGTRKASPASSDIMDDMEGSFNMDEIKDPDVERGEDKVKDEDKELEEAMVVSDDGEKQELHTDKVNGLEDKPAKRKNKRYSCENATAFAAKLRTLTEEELHLPSEPEAPCSQKLQDKIRRLYEKKTREGENLNQIIQERKDFRNPSIYDKLILFVGIEERGTNFPKSEFDPDFWRKCPSYEDLARTQREELAKKEKEKKTKVEFITGTAKKTTSGSGSGERKRTKWDDKPLNSTKPTVISAVGTIKKPRV